MLVYRVEDRNGCGPYECDALSSNLASSQSPMPHDDPGFYDWWNWRADCEYDDMRFGFSSPRQFRNWFSREQIDELAQKCVLRVYSTEAYYEGKFQLVFDRDASTLLNEYHLLTEYLGVYND